MSPVQEQLEQQEQEQPVDYAALYPRVRQLAADHPELVNFAYFLYFFGYYEGQEPEQSGSSFQMKVNFCSTAQLKSDSVAMNSSRLEQMYTAFFFTDCYCSADYDNPEEAIFGAPRGYCKMHKTCPGEACPYALVNYLCKYAQALGREPEDLFNDLLGSRRIPFAWADETPIALDPADIEGIDAKSAHGAYDLLKTQAISAEYANQAVVAYRYIPPVPKGGAGGYDRPLY